MLNYPAGDTRKVLVELSAIPVGGNGQISDQIANVRNIVEKTGLFYNPIYNGACIEGEWNEISSLIYVCYEQLQKQSPNGFLKVSIR
jgi:uncharacterized protein YqgV (UPF0045/DUF77 family)